MPVSIQLLGSYELISADGKPLKLRRKMRALMAYLASTGQPHQRQALAGMFCREAKDPAAVLRSLLSRIRRRLGADSLLTVGDSVQFNRQSAGVDSVAFACFRRCSRRPCA